jgi:hypothetical protein
VAHQGDAADAAQRVTGLALERTDLLNGLVLGQWALFQASGLARVAANTSFGKLFIGPANGSEEDGQDRAIIS